jgi:apolipoprotein N-acyltransferase
MTGAISLEQNQKLYTGMYGINNQAKVTFRYHKRHLVPFGEYIPWQWPFLKKLTPGMVDFTPGRHGQNIVFKDFKIAPLICYEVIFPDEVRVKSRQQDLLLNISNDAWYGNSSGPYQHYYIAQMRAVENGVPLVRAANNGISAIFDALGQVLIKTELNEITYIDAYIPHRLSHSTIYSLHSNILMMFLLISIIFCAVVNKLK